jgi:hypothetical protein
MSKIDIIKEFIGSLSDDVKIHMVNEPIGALKRLDQHSGPKPMGYWYDCNKEWISYISSEMPNRVGDYIYEVYLNKGSMLTLDTGEEVLRFSEEYGMIPDYLKGITTGAEYIDWARVSQSYTGIEICPYQSGLRMDRRTNWYYTWDLASGCVWNPVGMSFRFIGLWDDASNGVVSKDELVSGDTVISSRFSWYKRSCL